MIRFLLASLLFVLASGVVWAVPDPLSSLAERSEFKQTGRYEEMPRLLQAFAERWPEAVRWESFGTSPEGRELLSMVVSKSGALTAMEAKKRGLPVVLVQAGIHAGEVDGKDGGFLAIKELLSTQDPSLKNIVLVFVPIFNVDGHERFGAWNRPNQVGPEQMGWRVTSDNLNLNRDYCKAESSEMKSMLGLLSHWDPILYVDLHATDGLQFEPDVAVMMEPLYLGEPALQKVGKLLQDKTLEQLRRDGSYPLPFYPSLNDPMDPASGFSNGSFSPRFSTGYYSLRNRLTVLVETHSWKDYRTRVQSSKNTFLALVHQASAEGKEWLSAARQSEQSSSKLAGKPVTLSFKTGKRKTQMKIGAYAYQQVPSEVSGGTALVYDTSKTQEWTVPFFPDVEADLVIQAPLGGYLIPPAHAQWMAPHLSLHGVEFRRLEKALPDQTVEAFRATEASFSPKPFEGRQTAKLLGQWNTEKQPLLAGALFVPIAQSKARLIMALLEPQGQDSMAAWGYFNAHFEQKEYMEEYVTELVAKEMLSSQPELKKEFETRLETDPEFAKSQAARLDFFYRRHPSWDERHNLYPILRLNQVP